jgi:hypothetical protein
LSALLKGRKEHLNQTRKQVAIRKATVYDLVDDQLSMPPPLSNRSTKATPYFMPTIKFAALCSQSTTARQRQTDATDAVAANYTRDDVIALRTVYDAHRECSDILDEISNNPAPERVELDKQALNAKPAHPAGAVVHTWCSPYSEPISVYAIQGVVSKMYDGNKLFRRLVNNRILDFTHGPRDGEPVRSQPIFMRGPTYENPTIVDQAGVAHNVVWLPLDARGRLLPPTDGFSVEHAVIRTLVQELMGLPRKNKAVEQYTYIICAGEPLLEPPTRYGKGAHAECTHACPTPFTAGYALTDSSQPRTSDQASQSIHCGAGWPSVHGGAASAVNFPPPADTAPDVLELTMRDGPVGADELAAFERELAEMSEMVREPMLFSYSDTDVGATTTAFADAQASSFTPLQSTIVNEAAWQSSQSPGAPFPLTQSTADWLGIDSQDFTLPAGPAIEATRNSFVASFNASTALPVLDWSAVAHLQTGLATDTLQPAPEAAGHYENSAPHGFASPTGQHSWAPAAVPPPNLFGEDWNSGPSRQIGSMPMSTAPLFFPLQLALGDESLVSGYGVDRATANYRHISSESHRQLVNWGYTGDEIRKIDDSLSAKDGVEAVRRYHFILRGRGYTCQQIANLAALSNALELCHVIRWFDGLLTNPLCVVADSARGAGLGLSQNAIVAKASELADPRRFADWVRDEVTATYVSAPEPVRARLIEKAACPVPPWSSCLSTLMMLNYPADLLSAIGQHDLHDQAFETMLHCHPEFMELGYSPRQLATMVNGNPSSPSDVRSVLELHRALEEDLGYTHFDITRLASFSAAKTLANIVTWHAVLSNPPTHSERPGLGMFMDQIVRIAARENGFAAIEALAQYSDALRALRIPPFILEQLATADACLDRIRIAAGLPDDYPHEQILREVTSRLALERAMKARSGKASSNRV